MRPKSAESGVSGYASVTAVRLDTGRWCRVRVHSFSYPRVSGPKSPPAAFWTKLSRLSCQKLRFQGRVRLLKYCSTYQVRTPKPPDITDFVAFLRYPVETSCLGFKWGRCDVALLHLFFYSYHYILGYGLGYGSYGGKNLNVERAALFHLFIYTYHYILGYGRGYGSYNRGKKLIGEGIKLLHLFFIPIVTQSIFSELFLTKRRNTFRINSKRERIYFH